ncbi:hypothetical protein JCM5296_000600 [Sporobolomyces johnsonii]
MLPTLLRRAACSSAAAPALPPVRWTYLPRQIPYAHGLLLQESLVQARLSAKAALLAPSADSLSPSESTSLRRVAETDLLLLLQHTPVFTAGRREKDPVQAEQERERLGRLGADYVQTMRGGQTTYHGPGQLVGYPLMDLGPAKLSTRCYVDRLETFLSRLTTSLSVPVHPLEHTGVFVSPTSKIGSIGIHIRRRITLHGFSLNVEQQTRAWFDQIVACGLADVSSTSVEAELRRSGKLGTDESKLVLDVVPAAVELFGQQYGREMRRLEEGDEFVEARRMIEDGLEGRLPPLKKELLGV